jgi:hypothetical protein
MSAMNLATQKRLGKLPKTPESLTYKGHIYGNNHRGFGMRRPTPTSKGFYGLGSTASGDGKLHYFGDGPGQKGLASNGFYGIGSAELEFQAGQMLIPNSMENQPTHPAGIYGGIPDEIAGIDTKLILGVAVLGAFLIYAN